MARHVVALSGGKDSTAMSLRLRRLHPERDFIFFCTPTGDELPDLMEHWRNLETLLGKPLTYITNGTLKSWIKHFGALPNWRQRWCTRLLKIEPCIAFLKRLAVKDGEKPILYVGLRADEEEREGIYGNEVQSVYPLREWGWGIKEVRAYLAQLGVKIPKRTDCGKCYGQRIGEWKDLLIEHPAVYADAEQDEADTGHTFRSAARDSWPAPLAQLRIAFGQRPTRSDQRSLFDEGELEVCRVCRL